jgi:hypothetical protein
MAAPSLFVPSEETVLRTRALLREWLGTRLPAADLEWLDGECAAAGEDADPRRFFMAFSAVCRHAPKTPLDLDAGARAAADAVRPGWRPESWTAEQAARTLVLLSRNAFYRERWLAELHRLFEHADLGEQVALYQALPVLPYPQALVARCAEGVRTNMTDVFRAVAHRNPYPAEHLPEPAWNQMVLKALFVEVGIVDVHGLDGRANPALARMLCDYARERRAAGRPVPPELWRCVGPHADAGGLEDLAKALDGGDAATREAAADALRRCPWPEARHLLVARGFHLPEEDLP